MVIIPNTIVRLFSSIPIDPSYRNILLFEDENAQEEYFLNQDIVATFTNFNYVQETGAIRVPINKESLYNVNYIAYQNATFGNKWFYGFVDRVDYLSPNSSAIYFTMDVWQSWCWNLKFLPSFIERETVLDDTIGNNTIPENLEYGPVVKIKENFYSMNSAFCVVMFNKEVPDLRTNSPGYVSGYFFGCPYLMFAVSEQSFSENMATIIDAVSNETGLEIVNVYIVPSVVDSEAVSIPQKSLGNYIPRNNKLYAYPYCRAIVSVPGSSKEFRYEDLNSLSVFVKGGQTPSSNVIAIVDNKLGNVPDSVLQFNGYPLIPWTNNAYQEWCALKNQGNIGGEVSRLLWGENNNGVQAGVSMFLNGIIDYGSKILNSESLTDAIGNSFGSAVSSAIGGTNEILAAGYLPNKVFNNGASGETFLAANKYGIYASSFAIKPEYAKILDDYFSMYGYKVNRVKRIEIRGRKNWNYVKTIGANISGNCPMDVLTTIKRAFDSGITFWHIPNFDYGDMSNPIE